MLASSLRRTLVLTLVFALVGALALPTIATAKRKGKRSVGVVSAYDGTALTVDMRDGSVWDGEVSENTKVKLEHRGKPAARGNPTRGDLEDIEVGDKVLKLKARKGVVRFIRLRKANSDVEDANGGECKDAEVSEPTTEGGEPVEEPLVEEPVEEEPAPVARLAEEPVGTELGEEEGAEGEGEEGEVEEEGDEDRSCADKVDQDDDEEGSEETSTEEGSEEVPVEEELPV